MVWSTDLCPVLPTVLLLFLSVLPPEVGSLPGQVFTVALLSPASIPPNLLASCFISLSLSLCLCQQQPLLDTAVCFLSPLQCLHLSLSPLRSPAFFHLSVGLSVSFLTILSVPEFRSWAAVSVENLMSFWPGGLVETL